MADRDQTETSPGAESVGQEAGPGAFTGRRALSKSANDAGGTLHAVAAGNTTALTQLLGVSAIVDQAALERQVMAQADRMLTANEQAKERRRLDRTTTQIRRLEDHIAKALDRIERSRTVDQQSTHEKTLAKYETELSTVLADKQAIELRLQGLEAPSDGGQPLGPSSSGRAIESRRDRLIRTGKITPFASVDEEAPPATQPEWADAEDQRLAASRASVSSPEISLQGAAQPSMPSEDPATDAVHKDDGDELFYQTRLDKWAQQRHHLRQRVHPTCTDSSEPVERLTTSAADEPFLPHPSIPDLVISKRFRIPGDIHHRLFDYQKTCLRWLWELHTQKAGGIIGDEMGLGKTVQLIAFLGGMYYSQLLRGTRRHFHNQGDSSAAPPSVLLPSLIVCPATIMKQWVCEFHQWWPPLKVSVLHATGSARLYGSDQPPSSATGRPGGKRRRQRASGRGSDTSEPDDSDWEQPLFDTADNREKLQPASKHRRMAPASKRTADARSSAPAATPSPWAHSLIDRVFASGGHVLVTTYAGMRLYRQKLLSKRWGYVVLDEGHQIRNPDAEITLVCKQVKTSHRIILSGTPIQNNLTELWSLFDFVFPGRLGTLPVFQEQFSTPISLGGFANANNYQVQTAYKCACVLRDLIDPYLLRRLKADVACDLPDKQEQVLFCSLTPAQRRVYQEFLNSGEMESILEGRRQMLYGIDIVRKICNHPDLLMLPKSGIDPAAQFDEAADGRHRCGPETSKAATNKVDDFNRRRHHPRSRSASAQQTATAASGAFLAPSRHLPLHKVTDPQFGAVERSGKMLVVQMLLKMWAPQGHRALLFSQTRQMLDLLERM
ncbi:DNA repair protein rhp26, partial [Dimargaris verticillata]